MAPPSPGMQVYELLYDLFIAQSMSLMGHNLPRHLNASAEMHPRKQSRPRAHGATGEG